MNNVSLAIVLLASLVVAPPISHAQQPEGDPTEEEGGSDGETPEEGSGDVAAAPPVAETEDLASLRAEYFKLRDRLFQSRARASAVSSALFSTRLSLNLNYASARHYTVTRATIRLDGANIYDDSEGTIASDKATRFEGFIAPGRHQISIRIEAAGKDDDRFTSVIENTFTIQAIKGKDLWVKASAEDDGNIAHNWSKKESGSYRLHLNISVKSVKAGKKKSGQLRTGQLQQWKAWQYAFANKS